jgi:alpha-glucosidase
VSVQPVTCKAITSQWLTTKERDLDYLYLNRIFTHNANYAVEEGREFLARLHANGQYWLPILDPNVYVPDPTNASDAFDTYDRGKALDLYLKNGDEDYIGTEWPGFSVWPDFATDPNTQQYWTDEFKRYFEQLEYDGWWLDISDAPSWCTGSCGTGMVCSQVHSRRCP